MSEKQKPRVIVCQHGARRRYAIPRMLEESGILEALYTDSCEHSLLGKIAKAMGPLAKGQLKRLASRKVIGVPQTKVFSSDTLLYYSLNPFIYKTPERQWQSGLSKKMKSWVKSSENFLIYNMYCENLEFLKSGKQKGATVIIDAYINPKSNILLSQQRKEFGLDKHSIHGIDAVSIENTVEVFLLADILLCPSNWVAEGVRELCPDHSHKIRICPYGSSIHYGGRTNDPVKGRFFWAGGDWVRKGLHYLAEAADELKNKYPDMEFRAAGVTDPKIMQMERFRNITFLGKLDKEKMQTELLTADAFVFPTLSEGMAGTVIEAIAAGCPVITTKAAGVDAIEDGTSGLLVPTSNSVAVAQAMEKIYLDRELRNAIAKETVELAGLYTENAWKKRLVKIIEEVSRL